MIVMPLGPILSQHHYKYLLSALLQALSGEGSDMHFVVCILEFLWYLSTVSGERICSFLGKLFIFCTSTLTYAYLE